MNEAKDGFARHEKRDAAQDNRAGECTQDGDFARAEAEGRVVCVASGEGVGADGDQEGRDVRGHVPAIGEQGHRVEFESTDNFDNHHGRSQD